MIKELVVVSGKGGTGKTSLVASFAALADGKVLADCDVDAADLHLVVSPEIERRESFTGGKRARILPDLCTACGKCEELCMFDAIYFDGPENSMVEKTFRVEPVECEGCGVCAWFCPAGAIEFKPHEAGEWFISRTRLGPMVHARLGTAEENSGKLVSRVRAQARAISEERGLDLVIIDGAPGVGCPVIASITGADMVLIVTEPTLSGLHDLDRVLQLAEHFRIPAAVCVNKHNLNLEVAEKIEDVCHGKDIPVLGRVRYSKDVTRAMIAGESVVEYTGNPVAMEIREVWREVEAALWGRLRP